MNTGVDRPLNLALVTRWLPPYGGGTGVYYEKMSQALASVGHQVWLVSSIKCDSDNYLRAGVCYIYVPYKRSPIPGTSSLWWQYRVTRILQKLEKNHSLDVVVFPSARPDGLLYSLLRQRAVVCIRLHEQKYRVTMKSLLQNFGNKDKRRRRIQNLLCQVEFRFADAMMPVSDSIQAQYKLNMRLSGIRKKMIRHYPGIDMKHFSPTIRIPKIYRQQGHKKIILFVGRIVAAKGINNLLEAYQRRIALRHPDTALVIIGKGPAAKDLKAALTQELANRVIFLGQVDYHKLPQYYSGAYVIVGPSEHEGLGLVFVEALACGLPVIATNVGGIPEVVQAHRTGLLCKDNSVESIASALEHILSDPNLRESFSNRARASVLNKFNLENIAIELGETYRLLVAKKTTS